MKKVKVIISLALVLVLVFSLSGCWNYMDINQLFVVEGFAIDKDMETGEYKLIYEVQKAKSGSDSEISVRVATASGITIYQAIRNAIHEVGSKLYWGHASVCIIGKNAAAEGITAIMDTISRATEIKPSVLICYSEVEKLEDIFNVEDEIHDSTTQHIKDLFEESTSSGKFITAPMVEIVRNITSESPAFLLPNFEIEEHGEEKALMVKGSAVFVEDKYIGMLDEIESRSVNIFKKKVDKEYIIALSNSAFPQASIEVVESKIKFEPLIENNKPQININLDIKSRLTEIQVSETLNLDNIEHGLVSSFEELLIQQLGAVISRAQTKEKVDYLGFNEYFFASHPDFWDSMPGTWNDEFLSMDYDIKVNIEILGRGSIREPLEIGQE